MANDSSDSVRPRQGGLVERAHVAARLSARESAAALTSLGRVARSTPRTKTATVAAPPTDGAHAATTVGDVVPFNSIRRRTGEHLRRSLATAAHAFVVVDVDYSRIDPIRRRAGLTYLPFVARAVIDALRRYPQLNASVVDDGLRVHDAVNLGIAVDLDFEGLIVPVVHGAHELRLGALATRFGELAARARDRRLTPADVEGGTFTITNVGGYGTVIAQPIINQPQVAILSTDGVRIRPVAFAAGDGGWQVTARPVGNLSLSFDHRAVDGAYAAAFVASVRDRLEEHDWEAEAG